jgi:hypothetical protein
VGIISALVTNLMDRALKGEQQRKKREMKVVRF